MSTRWVGRVDPGVVTLILIIMEPIDDIMV